MLYCRGEIVEVASKEEGYVGSYYSARIVSKLGDGGFIVKYENLLKDDQSGPLVETVNADEVRPIPPKIQAKRYKLKQYVDAFDNDGWWVGRIVGKKGSMYSVYFDISKELSVYPPEKLRTHLEWSQGVWRNVHRCSTRFPPLF